jgi:hypothetical protein
VVCGQAHVGLEEDLQPALGGAVEVARRAAPEEPVVDEDEVCAHRGGPLEEFDIR